MQIINEASRAMFSAWLSGKPPILAPGIVGDIARSLSQVRSHSMSPPRFFCDSPLLADSKLTLPSAVSHHIRVRRLKAGQKISLFNGTGIEVTALLEFESSGQAVALLGETQAIDRELPHKLTLVQGIASQDRMDWVVEKAVELGAAALIPVSANRSVVKLNAERAGKRTLHWEKLVISASEQCGRNRLMHIHAPCSIEQAISRLKTAPMLLCHLCEHTVTLSNPALIEAIRRHQAASIVVGPEGGWDPSEANQWLHAGAQAITLGPRILRTETAGLASLAKLGSLLS